VGNYSLAPLATDAAQIDVSQIGDVGVSLTRFDYNFTSGICSIGPIEALIGAIVGDIAPRVRNGLIEYLRDPDGKISEKMGVDQLPSIIIIDKQGNIVGAPIGGLDPSGNLANQLAGRLDKIL
jgi:hypothetical protein